MTPEPDVRLPADDAFRHLVDIVLCMTPCAAMARTNLQCAVDQHIGNYALLTINPDNAHCWERYR